MKFSKTCLSLLAALAANLSATTAMAHDMVPGKAQTTPLLLTGLTVHTVTDGVKAELAAAALAVEEQTSAKVSTGN